ncbi:MAG: hypothetical protein IJW82_06570 [Clostridia bacterium]|nr:hypothetical protein [Clostridia bacterium]
MKCYKCGNELDYFNKTTLSCPFCHSQYTVSEKVAENQKNLQGKTLSTEKDRPNCSVFENTQTVELPKKLNNQVNNSSENDFVKVLEDQVKSLEEEIKAQEENLKSQSSKSDEKKKKDKKKEKKSEPSNKKIKDDTNKNNSAENKKGKKQVEVENKPKEIKKPFPPFIVLLNTFLMFVPICFLPFISIVKESYNLEKIEEDCSIFLYKNCTLDMFEKLFGEYFFLPLIAVILTLVILTLCVVGILQYLNKSKNLFILYELILALSLLLLVSYFVCYFSLPNEIYSTYKLNLISYVYFQPLFSLISLLVLKKSESTYKKLVNEIRK